MRHLTAPIRFSLLGLVVLGLGLRPPPTYAPTAITVYGDTLNAGWANWSWDSTVNFNNATPVHTGSQSLAVTYTQAWAGLYLHTDTALNTANIERLQFWLHGGSSGGQAISVALYDGANQLAGTLALTAPVANTWRWIDVPLTTFSHVSPTLGGLVWQSNSPNAQATFYLDEIVLTTPAPTALALSVDVATQRHGISPYIYGMNFTPASTAAALPIPLNRWGGNSVTRYNWQLEMTNLASDWYFENLPITKSVGVTFDQFVAQNQAAGVETIVTVPTIGWVAAPRHEDHPYDCGFQVSRYGAQQSVDPWDTNCGNGRHTNGTLITGNQPADTSIAVTATFAAQWTQHLVNTHGAANAGGVRFYALDNEPGLWFDTHRDVRPAQWLYDEARAEAYVYGAAIKAIDPTAQILGPVQDGWTRYFYAAYSTYPDPVAQQDRDAHGLPFVPWYLQQMQVYEQQHGVRLLDYLDLHYYPQAAGVSLAPAGSAATQALRLRTTRSLWDPTYADESWIADTGDGPAVQLIPRLKNWIATYYPGTKIAITEYNWGALDHLNGALAQAEVLGLFGREGVDLATLWSPPTATVPGRYAFQIFLDYDGQGHTFGDVSVSANSSDQGQLAIYAAQRASDGALTLLVINKTTTALTAPVALTNFAPAASAATFRYSAANLNAVQALPNQAVGPTGFSATFPAESLTLFVIPSGQPWQKVYVPLVRR